MNAINFNAAVARMQASAALRAYGRPAQTVASSPAVGVVPASIHTDSVSVSPEAARKLDRIKAELVGAKVSKGVEFGPAKPSVALDMPTSTPTPGAGGRGQGGSASSSPSAFEMRQALAMYALPAEQNTAATRVQANSQATGTNSQPRAWPGASLDLQG